ncbi:MarR family transcriptional regulator [Microbacterium sp. BK668]|uniref:MarR family winged helix-turn-helix transcriptional regulator n=1 Tax=Microbacterium sp. BK668 TaxID=2512118 RepID=UPI0014150EAA|nr:MarR family transcriptional regulator [Microbacterium sp. BK668]
MELLGRFNDDLTRVFDQALGTQWAEIEEMLAISSIVSEPSVTTRRLAEITRMNRRAVSRMVARMSADGLVHRHPSNADKRAVVASLTDEGVQRTKVLEASIVEFFRVSAGIAMQISEGLGPIRAPRETPEPTDAMDLLGRVCEAGVALVRFMPDAANQGQLAARQRAALVQIVTAGGVRPNDLSPALGVSRAGVAYIVDQLCAKGFITRHRGAVPGDRRAVILTATDAGVQAVRAVMSGIEQQSETLADLFYEVAHWQPKARSV